jgi:hypothetical protein
MGQVVEILKSSSSSDLFNPDVEKGGGTRRQDPVTKDLLAALLAVRSAFCLSRCVISEPEGNPFGNWSCGF